MFRPSIAKFKKLEEKFTKEEYTLLFGKINGSNLFKSVLELNVIKNERKILKKHSKKVTTFYTGIADYVYCMIPDFFKLLYVLPLKDMPLHINSKESCVATIASWRLEIGK